MHPAGQPGSTHDAAPDDSFCQGGPRHRLPDRALFCERRTADTRLRRLQRSGVTHASVRAGADEVNPRAVRFAAEAALLGAMRATTFVQPHPRASSNRATVRAVPIPHRRRTTLSAPRYAVSPARCTVATPSSDPHLVTHTEHGSLGEELLPHFQPAQPDSDNAPPLFLWPRRVDGPRGHIRTTPRPRHGQPSHHPRACGSHLRSHAVQPTRPL